MLRLLGVFFVIIFPRVFSRETSIFLCIYSLFFTFAAYIKIYERCWCNKCMTDLIVS